MQRKKYQSNHTSGNSTAIRIVILEENRNVRNNILKLLKYELQMEIVGVYGSVDDFLKNLRQSNPDMIIMDITDSGNTSSTATINMLGNQYPHIQILIETSVDEDYQIYQAIKAGASGYIFKSDLKDKLVQSIIEIRAGGSFMSPRVARRVIEMIRRKGCPVERKHLDYKLTLREKEVLAHIVNGKSYKMVGSELNISYETVRSHIKNIYEKLKVASLTELVAKSINFHIV